MRQRIPGIQGTNHRGTHSLIIVLALMIVGFFPARAEACGSCGGGGPGVPQVWTILNTGDVDGDGKVELFFGYPVTLFGSTGAICQCGASLGTNNAMPPSSLAITGAQIAIFNTVTNQNTVLPAFSFTPNAATTAVLAAAGTVTTDPSLWYGFQVDGVNFDPASVSLEANEQFMLWFSIDVDESEIDDLANLLGEVATDHAEDSQGGATKGGGACIPPPAPNPPPTVVRWSSSDALAYSSDQVPPSHPVGVMVRWSTGHEVRNLGFHVLREGASGRKRITPSLVAGSALMAGADTELTAGRSYTWWDPQADGTESYWIEAIDLNSERTLLGPIVPRPVDGSAQTSPLVGSTLLADLGGSGMGVSATQVVGRRGGLPGSSASSLTQWQLAAAEGLKIGVQKEGWYRLLQASLLAAGLDPGVDPRRLQLYSEALEHRIRVIGGDDGSLDPGDSIEFYGFGLDTRWSDERVYWLVEGDGPGLRVDEPRKRRPGLVAPVSFPSTIERRDRVIYTSAILNGDGENFFGPVITSDEAVVQNLTVSHPHPSSPSDAVLEVAIQGFSAGQHAVTVELAGLTLGTLNFEGTEHHLAQLVVPHSVLQPGTNTITLVASHDGDQSLLDSLRLTYRRSYIADQGKLRFTAWGGEQVTVTGFDDPRIALYDISDPAAVQSFRGEVLKHGGGFGIRVPRPDPGLRTYLALSEEGLEQTASLEANQPSIWNDSGSGAELVVLGHGSLLGGIQNLVTRRRSEGWTVAVVDIADVYDEFGFGMKSPYAIRNFLTHAATTWQRPPSHVLLLGDASLDPRGYRDSNKLDLLPTQQIDTEQFETASDDWLADFNDDGVADLALGRIPASTEGEVSLVVAKLLAYQDAPAGAWSQKVSMVSDDDGSTLLDFQVASEAVSGMLPEGLVIDRIALAVTDAASARSELLTQLNEGRLMVNYIGHGTANSWAGEGLLRASDVDDLSNGSRLPLVVAMSCTNGYFHSIFENSLASTLLLAPEGGAVAVWASSALTNPAEQLVMNQALMRQLFIVGTPTLGEAVRNAKTAVSDSDIRRTWIFFGDPTLGLHGTD